MPGGGVSGMTDDQATLKAAYPYDTEEKLP